MVGGQHAGGLQVIGGGGSLEVALRWVTEGEEVAAAAETDKMWCPYLTRCLWASERFFSMLWFFVQLSHLHTAWLPIAKPQVAHIQLILALYTKQ